MSLRKLSEVAGISNPYLSQIERGLRKPSAEILQQIAKALSLSAETLYVRAGILEEREGGDDFTAVLFGDHRLTSEQKQVLLRVYQSFVLQNGGEAMTTDLRPVADDQADDQPDDQADDQPDDQPDDHRPDDQGDGRSDVG
ncbi:MAG: helix-turn-helix domain-containing protein [Actinobacteria bacterium]|nr:helix-turn-helix domain-containing protein [Actinomycetota bacterium]